ncbi:serpentine type 7TM GPCR chemoreceptor srh domain-containing protein [Ditylenchus destructor]|uniref:Serpentine type 7TM GPCR chemoreceptor srh domain-containing protein n=1 Tax=Ditylenchus destructor TaxID=166010 RepID=A0AAD4MET4_9BILA|nr:serpentine type 7TM GPCR chemoreceptor srh domain-containing protein [Ditylenchus destructor]
MIMPSMLYPASCILSNGPYKYFGAQFCLIALCFTLFCVVNVKTAQDYCMMYRLTVILPNKRIHEYFMKWQIAVLTQLFLLGLSLETSLTLYLSFREPGALTKEYIDTWFVEPIEEYWRLPDFNRNATILCTNWFSPHQTRLVWTGISIIAVSEVFCFVMAATIFGILRKNISRYESKLAQLGIAENNRILPYHVGRFSRKTYSMHLQLTTLIVVQYISPIIFLIGPLSVLIYKQFGGTDVPTRALGDSMVVAFSLYGCANTLLTLAFVAPYRNFTKKKLLGLLLRIGLRKRPDANKFVTSANTFSLNRLPESSFNIDSFARISERNVSRK